MFFSYAGIIYCMELFLPGHEFYCAQYVMLTFIIHAQAFQILVYSKMIRFQLTLFNSIKTEELDMQKQENFEKALLLIFNFAEKVNETFSASLLTVMIYVYMSLLENLHWFLMGVLQRTHLIGKQNCS